MKRFLWFGAFILVISSATAQTGANPQAPPPKSHRKEERCSGARQRQGSTGAARCFGPHSKAIRGAAPTVGAGKVPASAIAGGDAAGQRLRAESAGQRRAGPDHGGASPAIGDRGPASGGPGIVQRYGSQSRIRCRGQKSKDEDKKISALQDALPLQWRHPGTR